LIAEEVGFQFDI